MRVTMEAARSVKLTYGMDLLRKRNTVACGIGYKITGGQVTDELAVIVSVTQKLPVAQLSREDLVPKMVDGVPTDVVETGVIRAFQGHQDRWRPARPGISVGHYAITAGTFGCLVRREDQHFILSNNHVLANINQGRPGDAILQPGPADGGTQADKIAELADYVPIDFGAQPPGCAASLWGLLGGRRPAQPTAEGENRVDAALARPLSGDLVSADILEIGVPTGVAEATLGTRVQKSGRTTGLTTGQITQIDVTVRVDYNGPTATFVGQLMAGAMSAPGDSGSAVLDMERRVVGLLFAGSDVTTLINPIQAVLEALRVEVVT